MPSVSTSLVLARPGTPTSRPWPPDSTVTSARSTTMLLAEDDGADRVLRRAHMRGGRLRRAHDHVFELFEAFAACHCHGLCILLRRDGPLRSVSCRHAETLPERVLDAMQQRQRRIRFAPRGRISPHVSAKLTLSCRHSPVASRRCDTAARASITIGKQWRRKGRAGWRRSRQRCRSAQRACRRSSSGIRRFAATSTCASPPTAPGSTRRRRSAGRRWSSCSPPCSRTRATSISSSRRWKRAASTVDDAPFLAVEMTRRGTTAAADAHLPHQCRRRGHRRARPCAALRAGGEPAACEPYLHVRRDLWAKVTRALFYDLVELGEERDVDGRRMFGVASAGEFFAMARGRQPCGSSPDARTGRARRRALTRSEFFARARERLTLETPHGLTDPNVIAAARRSRRRSGDGEDRRGAADPAGRGAGAGGRPSRADGAADAARAASARPSRAGLVSRRQDRQDRRKPDALGVARGGRGDRARPRASSSRSAISIST